MDRKRNNTIVIKVKDGLFCKITEDLYVKVRKVKKTYTQKGMIRTIYSSPRNKIVEGTLIRTKNYQTI